MSEELTFTITVPLVPEDNPVHVGAVAEFFCNGPSQSINRQWLINGTQFESLNLTDVTVELEGIRLRFTNTPLEYSGTTVQCTLTAANGVQLSSTVGTLLVQGIMTASYPQCISVPHIIQGYWMQFLM